MFGLFRVLAVLVLLAIRSQFDRWSLLPSLPSGRGGSASTNRNANTTTVRTFTHRSKVTKTWTPVAETTPASFSPIPIPTDGTQTGTPPNNQNTSICDFQRLHVGAALLQQKPQLDMAVNADLEEWQAVARQLGELRRLLDIHRDAIVAREGARATELVGFRLRVVSSSRSPPDNTGGGGGEKEDDDHRAVMAAILRGVEIDILDIIALALTKGRRGRGGRRN
ncbi:hypothetical protein F5B17DRAFT_449094 [Nemania serpens]|nr:hypothetical protein F5B17DRAFT_449094 [Nemania serpens]